MLDDEHAFADVYRRVDVERTQRAVVVVENYDRCHDPEGESVRMPVSELRAEIGIVEHFATGDDQSEEEAIDALVHDVAADADLTLEFIGEGGDHRGAAGDEVGDFVVVGVERGGWAVAGVDAVGFRGGVRKLGS